MTLALKLIPTLALAAVIVAGLTVRPPRTPVTPRELIGLVAGVTALYLAGAGAWLTHRTALAAVVFGAGLALGSLAVWLARGIAPPRRGDNGGGDPPLHPVPPVEPVSPLPPPDFDWSFYEDAFREPVGPGAG